MEVLDYDATKFSGSAQGLYQHFLPLCTRYIMSNESLRGLPLGQRGSSLYMGASSHEMLPRLKGAIVADLESIAHVPYYHDQS